MAAPLPHLTTDQVVAFLEFSRHNQIRAASRVLGISEQGLRNRLVTLEAILGVELYHKSGGPRCPIVLTEHGRRFLPHALAFVERAWDLSHAFDLEVGRQEIHVAASQYLARYVLIDVLKSFRKHAPTINVRVSTMSESEIEQMLLREPEIAFGLAAPYGASPDLDYKDLFSMSWSLICSFRHPLGAKAHPKLEDISTQPLILYERGSTGRQHVLDAFHERALVPRVALETTSTETIVSMVEAGLGVSIVPLLPSGVVTRGRRVNVRPVGGSIRSIHSGVLTRRGQPLTGAATQLLDFIRLRFA